MDKDVKLPGKGLKETDFTDGSVLFTTGAPNTHYRWDAGYAIGRFLEGLKEGKILGVKCNKCKRIVTPPRIFCEKCFKEMDEWVELQDTGTVNTFSICYVTWDMKRTKEVGMMPEIPAVIEIDGTNPRVGFLHKVGEIPPKEPGALEVDPKSVWVGMRVKAVWKPKEQREGRITDILYFKPISE